MDESGVIRFEVPGVPAPQGNKTAYVRGGRAVLVEGRRGPAREHFQSWRNAVGWHAAEAMRTTGAVPLTGPVHVDVVFAFTRPKSHLGTGRNAETVKQTAPRFHTSKPDLDKLVRTIGDAITGIVLADDSQIARLTVTKLYDASAGASIVVQQLDNTQLGRQAA